MYQITYQITVRYRTPAGRASEYTEEVGAASYAEAKALALRLLDIDRRRRVASITGFTGIALGF
jgi:hypothetical protein